MVIEQVGLKTYAGISEEEIKKKDKLLSEIKQFEVPDAFVDDFLKKVNFKAMRDLFRRDFNKSGGNPDANFEILNRDRIVVLGKEGVARFGAVSSGLMYTPDADAIIINVPRLNEMFKDQSLNTTSILVQQLFHEEGHFVDAGYVKRISDQTAETQSGLHKITIINKRVSHKFSVLNEAVNDLRARRLALEFIHATGLDLSRQDTEWLTDNYYVPQSDINFFVAIHLFYEICHKIAFEVGVNEKTVEDSFTHAAFNGLKLYEKGTKMELDLDSIFGKRFTDQLGELNIGDSLGVVEFMRKFNLNGYEAKYRKYINEFLAKYKKK